MHEQAFTIADLCFELRSELPTSALGIEERLGPFYQSSPQARGSVAVSWSSCDHVPQSAGRLVYDPGSIWRMFAVDGGCEAEISYNGEGAALLRANAAWDEVAITEQLHPRTQRSMLAGGVSELMLRTALLSHGGLVLHSAGLDDNGRGIVFVGHSGAGKSTQCGIWADEPGVVAMNDDRIAVRPEGSGVRCYGTPWGGTANIARNHSVPLAVLVIIEQAPENTISAIPPAAAAPLLLARMFAPYWDAALMAQAMANLNDLLSRVPVYRLRCRPEPAVIPLVRSVL